MKRAHTRVKLEIFLRIAISSSYFPRYFSSAIYFGSKFIATKFISLSLSLARKSPFPMRGPRGDQGRVECTGRMCSSCFTEQTRLVTSPSERFNSPHRKELIERRVFEIYEISQTEIYFSFPLLALLLLLLHSSPTLYTVW